MIYLTRSIFSLTLKAEPSPRPYRTPRCCNIKVKPHRQQSQWDARTLVTWNDEGVSWINREGSAGWREECQRCWQLDRGYRWVWSTAAACLYCWLVASRSHFSQTCLWMWFCPMAQKKTWVFLPESAWLSFLLTNGPAFTYRAKYWTSSSFLCLYCSGII